MKKFIELGADVNETNNKGQTPVEIADKQKSYFHGYPSENKYDQVIDMLNEAEANAS